MLKKLKDALVGFAVCVIVLLALPFLCLVALLLLPFDYVRYRCSLYYKNTKIKYTLFAFSDDRVRLCNAILKEDLPINYYKDCDTHYFLYGDKLLLTDYLMLFDENFNIEVENDDGDIEYVSISETVRNDINAINNLLGETVCNKAVVFVGKDGFDNGKLPKSENCIFAPIDGNDYLGAVKNYINNKRTCKKSFFV